jgi:hypothetical protein
VLSSLLLLPDQATTVRGIEILSVGIVSAVITLR